MVMTTDPSLEHFHKHFHDKVSMLLRKPTTHQVHFWTIFSIDGPSLGHVEVFLHLPSDSSSPSGSPAMSLTLALQSVVYGSSTALQGRSGLFIKLSMPRSPPIHIHLPPVSRTL